MTLPDIPTGCHEDSGALRAALRAQAGLVVECKERAAACKRRQIGAFQSLVLLDSLHHFTFALVIEMESAVHHNLLAGL